MRSAFSPWPKAPRMRKFSGSSPASGRSSRSTLSTSRARSPKPSGRIASRSRPTRTSTRCSDECAAPAPVARENLDQPADPQALSGAVRPWRRAYDRVPARRQARRRPLRRRARRGFLRREHVPSRARRVEGGARPSRGAAARRRLPAARHAVHDRAISRRSARGRFRATPIASCSSARSSRPAASFGFGPKSAAYRAKRRLRRWG